MTTRASFMWALVVLLISILTRTLSSPEVCSRPSFTIESPLENTKGKVAVVLMTKGSCSKCLDFGNRLSGLLTELRELGMVEIDFIAVAEREQGRWLSKIRRGITQATIYVNGTDGDLYREFDANTNDVLIYDRCGKMTFFVPWIDYKRGVSSHLNLVENALSRTYTVDLCAKTPCEVEPPPVKIEPTESVQNNGTLLQVEPEEATVKATKPRRGLWSYFKSFFGYGKENSDEVETVTTTKPTSSDTLEQISKQEACNRLSKDICKRKPPRLKIQHREHQCCGLVHEGNTNGKDFAKLCSRMLHTIKHCNKVALKDICCRAEEVISKGPEVCRFECHESIEGDKLVK